MIHIITENEALTLASNAQGRIPGLIVTHSEPFHADDTFAVTALSIIAPDAKVVMTRNPALVQAAEYVVDIGGKYDAETNRFDHHQKGGAGARTDKIPYASFGLVWEKFGIDVVGALDKTIDLVSATKIAKCVDRTLVASVDATDNGVGVPSGYSISRAIASYNPPWDSTMVPYSAFTAAVNAAYQILTNEIKRSTSEVRAETRIAHLMEERALEHVLVLPEYMPWQNAVLTHPDNRHLYYVVFPDSHGTWRLLTVPAILNGFEPRRPLPAAWAGREAEALQQITGVSDATFCHNNRFVAGAKSFEGVMRLVALAHLEWQT